MIKVFLWEEAFIAYGRRHSAEENLEFRISMTKNAIVGYPNCVIRLSPFALLGIHEPKDEQFKKPLFGWKTRKRDCKEKIARAGSGKEKKEILNKRIILKNNYFNKNYSGCLRFNHFDLLAVKSKKK